MQTKTNEKLRVLLANARRELQEVADDHGGFLNQLRLIQRSVDAHEPSDEELEATLRAFPETMRPMRVRGGAPAGEGSKETRKLWEELNQLVQSRQEDRHNA